MSLNTPLSGGSSITTQHVIDHYSNLAREDSAKNAEHIKKVAESFGYAPEDLANIPEGANLGVSCGNPFAIAGVNAVSFLFSPHSSTIHHPPSTIPRFSSLMTRFDENIT
jgi:hypothetical protein